jgi:hypothetical protein
MQNVLECQIEAMELVHVLSCARSTTELMICWQASKLKGTVDMVFTMSNKWIQ